MNIRLSVLLISILIFFLLFLRLDRTLFVLILWAPHISWHIDPFCCFCLILEQLVMILRIRWFYSWLEVFAHFSCKTICCFIWTIIMFRLTCRLDAIVLINLLCLMSWVLWFLRMVKCWDIVALWLRLIVKVWSWYWCSSFRLRLVSSKFFSSKWICVAWANWNVNSTNTKSSRSNCLLGPIMKLGIAHISCQATISICMNSTIGHWRLTV